MFNRKEGLFKRLLRCGVHPAYALALANASYPAEDDEGPEVIIETRAAQKLTQELLKHPSDEVLDSVMTEIFGLMYETDLLGPDSSPPGAGH